MSQAPITEEKVTLQFFGVPKDFDDAQLIDFISKRLENQVQIISCNVLKDWNTHKSRGSAFVTATSTDAVKICTLLNHTTFDDGSELNITYKYHESPPKEAMLFIGNLHVNTTYDDFERDFGSVHGAELVSCRLKNLPTKKIAIAQYKTIDDAKKILALDGSIINDIPIQIKPYVPLVPNEFKTVFVKNFEKISLEEFRNIFEKYGPLKSIHIFEPKEKHDDVTTYSAAVTFLNHDDAVKTIEDLNGKPFPSQSTPVDVIRFKTKGQKEFESYDTVSKQLTLFFVGFNDRTTVTDLRQFVEQFGEIDSIKIMTDENGHSKNYAYVKFKNLDSYNKAKAANGELINGDPIRILSFIPPAKRREMRNRYFANFRTQFAQADDTGNQQDLIESIPDDEFEDMDDEDMQ